MRPACQLVVYTSIINSNVDEPPKSDEIVEIYRQLTCAEFTSNSLVLLGKPMPNGTRIDMKSNE